jgi:hypothetical protein
MPVAPSEAGLGVSFREVYHFWGTTTLAKDRAALQINSLSVHSDTLLAIMYQCVDSADASRLWTAAGGYPSAVTRWRVRLLYEAAVAILTRVRRASSLKDGLR